MVPGSSAFGDSGSSVLFSECWPDHEYGWGWASIPYALPLWPFSPGSQVGERLRRLGASHRCDAGVYS